MEPTSAQPAVPRKRSRKSAQPSIPRPAKPRNNEDVKATIVMPGDLSFVLGSVAGFKSMDRSELAVKLIKQGLMTEPYRALYDALLPFTKLGDKANGDGSSGDNDRPME
jgi:hypothetical protein